MEVTGAEQQATQNTAGSGALLLQAWEILLPEANMSHEDWAGLGENVYRGSSQAVSLTRGTGILNRCSWLLSSNSFRWQYVVGNCL